MSSPFHFCSLHHSFDAQARYPRMTDWARALLSKIGGCVAKMSVQHPDMGRAGSTVRRMPRGRFPLVALCGDCRDASG
jgi:hypothetical protein